MDAAESSRVEAEKIRQENESARLKNEAEWQKQGEAAVEAAQTATEAASAAGASAEAAAGSAGTASSAAQTAPTAQNEASASAEAASGSAGTASSAAQTATAAQNAASTSAEAAAGSAETASSAAQTATQKASEASSSASAAASDANEVKELIQGLGGFDGKASSVSAVDSLGLLGTENATSTVQALIDVIADKVLNQLLSRSNVVNNALTTEEGYALDARMGKSLQDQITAQNSNLNFYYRGENPNKDVKTLASGIYQIDGGNEAYTPTRWGMLIVFSAPNYGYALFTHTDGSVYVRTCSQRNGSYYIDWKKLSTT